ncbi:hypothetical protein NIES2135_61410 (plasmid) [Leptolyngbya boryana NIES-2135]|jgi:hypothetical protein|uniref:Uncharacterized protein n=1 Tax=Leptolyngbya boryana NIES-2135 TaxID=1973484 RepID=A0A1Z4JRD7_LEPBY|nr:MULTISPECIES: hypothetical protein [Leptolyngbya]BAY59264.1 hypothetical protein NIES2135_61410 [Leptolyngbya boryana NIES-2135]MBD2372852.1 hypothetical protein [Leptolyngbya sp. FACHB-238]MBD2397395.1 hypothetical protein [Leptolyngbya sp. FACHB-239]MBD2403800.1 hypothetical protein [Leptolyngbya sp. FACHB-402]ULP33456.1 hypothetical protein MCP04_30470 [Leptolyngbya boryana IU 594]
MQKTIYFSGVNSARNAKLIARSGGSIMFSPPTKLNEPSVWACVAQSVNRNVLDSGAYYGFSDVAAYAAILDRVHSHFRWAANLDVIGNQHQSNQHYEQLHQRLPGAVADKILWVLQTDGDPAMISDYGRNRLVGIGGLVPLRRHPEQLMRYLDRIASYLVAAGSTAHLFGMTNPKILKWAAFQEWFESVDSRRWMYGLTAKELLTVNGDAFDAEQRGFLFTPEERVSHNIRVLKAIVETPEHSLQLELPSIAVSPDLLKVAIGAPPELEEIPTSMTNSTICYTEYRNRVKPKEHGENHVGHVCTALTAEQIEQYQPTEGRFGVYALACDLPTEEKPNAWSHDQIADFTELTLEEQYYAFGQIGCWR